MEADGNDDENFHYLDCEKRQRIFFKAIQTSLESFFLKTWQSFSDLLRAWRHKRHFALKNHQFFEKMLTWEICEGIRWSKIKQKRFHKPHDITNNGIISLRTTSSTMLSSCEKGGCSQHHFNLTPIE